MVNRSKTPKGKSKPAHQIHHILPALETTLPKGFAKVIERDLTGSGKYAIARRIAMAYLEIPWEESTVRFENLKAAASLKAYAAEIHASIQAYKSIVDWMKKAHLRMTLALDIIAPTGRKDTH